MSSLKIKKKEPKFWFNVKKISWIVLEKNRPEKAKWGSECFRVRKMRQGLSEMYENTKTGQ